MGFNIIFEIVKKWPQLMHCYRLKLYLERIGNGVFIPFNTKFKSQMFNDTVTMKTFEEKVQMKYIASYLKSW